MSHGAWLTSRYMYKNLNTSRSGTRGAHVPGRARSCCMSHVRCAGPAAVYIHAIAPRGHRSQASQRHAGSPPPRTRPSRLTRSHDLVPPACGLHAHGAVAVTPPAHERMDPSHRRCAPLRIVHPPAKLGCGHIKMLVGGRGRSEGGCDVRAAQTSMPKMRFISSFRPSSPRRLASARRSAFF